MGLLSRTLFFIQFASKETLDNRQKIYILMVQKMKTNLKCNCPELLFKNIKLKMKKYISFCVFGNSTRK